MSLKGEYLEGNYSEKVKIGGVTLPCECWVEVYGGGKVIVNHNGIKEMTGWKDKQVRIRGRLEDTDTIEIYEQIKSILSMAEKEEALEIISKETEAHGIKKIVLENDPQITLIPGFDDSRQLLIEGTEDEEPEIAVDLAKKKKQEKKDITDPKKEEKEETVVVKKGDTLSKIANKEYGNWRLWKLIWKANRDKVGKDPNKIFPKQELVIPDIPTTNKDYIVKKGDSYKSISKDNYGLADYSGHIKKSNGYNSLLEGDSITIPALQTYENKQFAKKKKRR